MDRGEYLKNYFIIKEKLELKEYIFFSEGG